MSQIIFRKEALDKQFKEEEWDLKDNPLNQAKFWLIACIAWLIAGCIWFAFGTIKLYINCMGIITFAEGKFYSLAAKENQKINKIIIPKGFSKKGDILFELDTSEIESVLQKQLTLLNKLKNKYEYLYKTIYDQQQQQQIFFEQKDLYLKNYIDALNDKQKYFMKKIEKEKNLTQKRFITENTVFSTKERLIETIVEKEKILSELNKDYYELLREQTIRHQELASIEYYIQKSENDIVSTKERINRARYLLAPEDGLVTEIRKSENEYVLATTILAEFLSVNTSEEYELLCFVPVEEAKKIKIGNLVYFKLRNKPTVNFANKQGKVTRITRMPVSREYIEKIIGQNSFSNALRDTALIIVHVKLMDQELSINDIGTLVDVEIILAKLSPFQIIYNVFN